MQLSQYSQICIILWSNIRQSAFSSTSYLIEFRPNFVTGMYEWMATKTLHSLIGGLMFPGTTWVKMLNNVLWLPNLILRTTDTCKLMMVMFFIEAKG